MLCSSTTQYQAEVLRLTLRRFFNLATFNNFNAVRDALSRLRLPYCFIIAPPAPQLGPDFASVVLVPKWLPQAGRQVIVYDFRALDGPVYARLTYETVSHQECEQEAIYRGYTGSCIYVQGIPGPSRLAIRSSPPSGAWCSFSHEAGLPRGAARCRLGLADHSGGSRLPSMDPDRPVLTLHHARDCPLANCCLPGESQGQMSRGGFGSVQFGDVEVDLRRGTCCDLQRRGAVVHSSSFNPRSSLATCDAVLPKTSHAGAKIAPSTVPPRFSGFPL